MLQVGSAFHFLCVFYYISTHLSTCLVTFQLPFSHQIMYCLDPLTGSYCLQRSVSEVFNNQLCMQFTRRLMSHEGMSHLRCHRLQMGLPVLSKVYEGLWLLKDRQEIGATFLLSCGQTWHTKAEVTEAKLMTTVRSNYSTRS